jgi:hypothetical protein
MWVVEQERGTGTAKRGAISLSAWFCTVQHTIYAASDEKLQQATSESDLVQLLEAVPRKLGSVQQSNLRNTGVAWLAGQGATVTLVYETRFAEGSAIEKFVWHIKDNNASLYGYNINSNALVAKWHPRKVLGGSRRIDFIGVGVGAINLIVNPTLSRRPDTIWHQLG